MTINNQGIVEYIRGLVSLRNRLPYEQIGQLLSEILVPTFDSPDYKEYISHLKSGIFVKPDELVKNYPPFWNIDDSLNYISRRKAQQETINVLKEKPVIFLSCDGGLYHNTSNFNPANVIRQSAVIQAPLIRNPAIVSNSFFVQPEIMINENPSHYMTAGEFRTLICFIQHLYSENPSCNSYGCPNKNSNNCPMKNFKFDIYKNLIKETKINLVCFMDRPVIPNYMRNLGRGYSKVSQVYLELLEISRRYKVPILSVIQSSRHKAITSLILDLLAGRAYIPESVVIKPFIEFIKNNPKFIKSINLESKILNGYNLNETEDLILLLKDQWQESEFNNIFMDYSIFKHFIKGLEYRSNSFQLHDSYTKHTFPKTDFHFFYVGYGNDWVRVEYVNATPEDSALYYYMQTCFGGNYPFIVKIAHEKAVVRRNFIKSLNLVLRKFGYNRPTLKNRTKY